VLTYSEYAPLRCSAFHAIWLRLTDLAVPNRALSDGIAVISPPLWGGIKGGGTQRTGRATPPPDPFGATLPTRGREVE